MYKPPKNPQIEEITKSFRGRTYRLSDLGPIKLDGKRKNCVWCLKPLMGSKHKWCSHGCIVSALSWAQPNSGYGLRVLLYKCGFKCCDCGFSYRSYFEQAFSKVRNRHWFRHPRMRSKRIEILIKAFRRLVPRDVRPEVDHVDQVSLGGQTIGTENLQILCAKCHKLKTKKDAKARLAVKGSPRKGIKFSESHRAAMSRSRKGFDSLARKAHREAIYETNRIPVIAVNLSTGEQREFSSCSEAASALGLQSHNISRILKGERKRHKGWTFKRP